MDVQQARPGRGLCLGRERGAAHVDDVGVPYWALGNGHNL